MANADIYVAFGADTGGLEAALAVLNVQVKSAARELAAAAKQMKDTGAAADSELGQKIKSLGGTLAEFKAQAKDVTSQLAAHADAVKGVGHAHGNTRMQMMESAHVMKSLVDETIATGQPLRGLALESGRIFEIISSGIPPIVQQWGGVAAAVLAAAGTLGYFVYQAVAATSAAKALQLDGVVAGFRLSDQAARDLVKSIEGLAGVGPAAAEEIIKPFLELGQGGDLVAQLVAPHLATLAQQLGKTLPEAAAEAAKRFQDYDGAGRKVLESTDAATSAQRRQYDEFVRSGQIGKAWVIQLDVMSQQLKAFEDRQTRVDAVVAETVPDFAEAGSAGSKFAAAVSDVSGAAERAQGEIEAMDARTRALRASLDQASNSARVFAAGLGEAMKVDKVAADIQATRGEIAKLQSALAAGPDRATPATTELGRALDIARDKLKGLQQQADAGIGGGDALSEMSRQLAIFDATFRGSDADRLRHHQEVMQAFLATDVATGAQRNHVEQEVATNAKAIRDADNESFLRQQEAKVAAAGKNSAAVIAIRQAELAHEVAVYGGGSKQAEEAEDRLARAKERAAERGAKAAEKGAKDELGATEEGIKGQIKALEDAEKLRADHENALVKLHKESAEKAATDTVAALTKEKAAIDALYAHEAELAGLTATKKREILDQEAAFNDQIALKIQEANEKAAEATTRAWTQGANQISGAINAQWRGILSGQESWGTAARKILADWVLEGIQDATKLAFNVIAQYVAMGNAATVSGAVQAAAQQTAQAGGIASLVANAVKAITVDAGQTAAGVSAWLAPIVGPAAPAAGAAAGATVAAMASFDVGAWNVPQDQIALIHKGEMVPTAAQSDAIRSLPGILARGGGSGGAGQVAINPSTHFHVNALDGASVGQWFRGNQRELMRAIDGAVRNGAHLGLRRIASA